MPGREARDGTIMTTNLIQSTLSKATPTSTLSINTEKALDKMNWSFLKLTLKDIGLGPSILRWIEFLYSAPTTQFRANRVVSTLFPIINGTCQGCPLLPLIFILTLELFLTHVRANNNIRGIESGHNYQKVSAYTRGLLFLSVKKILRFLISNITESCKTFG